MAKKINTSRREFLRNASVLSTVGSAAAPFALNLATMGAAAAQTVQSDYKAIVCLFLSGGNDHANTVLATDPTSWGQYLDVRTTAGADSIALAAPGGAEGVLPITPVTSQAGRSFALHPSLAQLKTLFDAGRAAVVANVGPLLTPTTKTQYKAGSVPLPPKLFSHNDQQSLWQAYAPEGAKYGWGGRMGDLMASMNSTPFFTCVSASGNAVLLSGKTVNQYQVSASGAVPILGLTSLFGLPAGANPLKAIVTGNYANLFEKEHAAIVKRSIDAQEILSLGMLAAGAGGVPNPSQYTNPVTGAASTNTLATQFQTVARMIGGRSVLGVRRQVFFISLGGFDSHDLQKSNQANLLAKVAHALSYFDDVLAGMQGGDMRSQVTTFTASDFGRTFTSNGDGTDHGWGSHHFVVGGAVKGNDIYGAFPPVGLGHDLDVGSGALLPAISVDQYGATLARWFGVSSSGLLDIFPNLGNFTSRDLGFMK